MIKAVIFDLDDTLVPEMAFIESGYRTISESLGKNSNLTSEDIYIKMLTLFTENKTNVFNKIYEYLGMDFSESDIKNLVRLYREHKPTLYFYDDVLETIKKLRDANYKLGIITDGFAVSQRNKVESLDLEEYFDEIIITDEFGKNFWKPSELPFEMMREKLNVQFSEMAYVGDNPTKDFFISERFPISTIRIKRENGVYLQAPYLKGVKEKFEIDTLSELNNILRME